MNIILCSREEEQRTLAHGIILCTEDEADYLAHYGVTGQKWGVRQWQNADGSLTAEGYVHYGIGQGNRNRAKADKYQMKANKVKAKADRLQSKADKYSKKADEQDARGKARYEKDIADTEKSEANKEREEKGKAIVQKCSDLVDRMSQYENYSPEEKKKFGDELLRGIKDYGDWASEERNNRGLKVGQAHLIEGFNDSRKLENDLINLIDKKSGSWNSGDWIEGSHAEKAYPSVVKAYEDVWAREDKIKQEIKYQKIPYNAHESIFTANKRKRENEHLQRALKSDKVWSELNNISDHAERDLAGAILKDLGFSDTPENRSLIWPYTYID